MKTEIFLVRHGLPLLQKSLLGKTNSPLSYQGWKQLVRSVARIEYFDTVISSPLSRCSDFAYLFSKKKNKKLLIVDNLQEYSFGDWDGLSYQALHQKYPQESTKFFQDPYNNPPPNGETLHSFHQRVVSAFLSLVEQNKGQRLLIFTHAGVIRSLVAWCLNMDYSLGNQFHRFALDYASLSQLSLYHDDPEQEVFPQLIRLNDVATV